MGFWPFGGGKRQRGSGSKHAREHSSVGDPSENMGKLEKASTGLIGNTQSSKNLPDKKARRLSKQQSPPQEPQQRSQTEPLPIPTARQLNRNMQPFSEKEIYQQNPTSQSSLGPDNFNVIRQPPTLYSRRPEQDTTFARRKSSKRKAEDYAREREVRAMSSSPIPIPIARRPNSFYGSPSQRETRDVSANFSAKLNRPSSQFSLPHTQALPTDEDFPRQHAFKIGTFAALSPRPTVKYDSRPKNARGKQPQRPNPLANVPIVEDNPDNDRKRINELADDLDAGGLRELMDRDKRRRERKTQQDQARVQRRLQRRVEKEREEEARKERTEEYVSASASRVSGLGVEGSTKSGQDSRAGPSRDRSRRAKDPFRDPRSDLVSTVPIRNPFEDEKDFDVMHGPGTDDDEMAVPAKSPLRKVQRDAAVREMAQPAISPPISPETRPMDRQSTSQGSLLNREAAGDMTENASFTGAQSDHSSQRLSSWTAFFKRGGTRRKVSSSFQGRSTPSEFSNTSRESFARKQQPPPAIQTRTFRRVDSATPQRTMSKFKEDLPELPISPPDSRMQSPEATVPPTTSAPMAVGEARESTDGPDTSAFTPSSPFPAADDKQETKPSMESDTSPGPKPETVLSQSLASVDSEGSWLSGKPLNRRSGASQRLKQNVSSLPRQAPPGSDGANESSLTNPDPSNPPPAGQSGQVDETWHAGVGRQPTLVRQAPRARSKEGLLNEYTARARQDSSPDTDDTGDDEAVEQGEPVTLMRAKSVDYKSHARHISAGSAKLLDIKRSSTNVEDLWSQSQSPNRASQDQLSREPQPSR